MRRHFKKLVLFSFLFAFLSVLAVVSHSEVYALDPSQPALCQSEEILWDKFVNAYPALDLRRTTGSIMIYGLSGGPMTLTTGLDTNTVGKCAAVFMNQSGKDDVQCVDIDPTQCETVNQVPSPETSSNGSLVYNLEEYTRSSVSGSLLGVANFIQGIVINEPVPVNLALFWNDSVSRVPFFGKALAQESSYSGPFLDLILGIWKVTRNFAFGILSAVMVVIGIMIMSRKKLNPQVYVTAQTALPRVVLAVILIAFSYPIGAAIASMGWSMGFSFHDFISKIDWGTGTGGSGGTSLLTGGIGTIIILLIGHGVVTVGVSAFVIPALIITAVICLILFIIAFLKILVIYFKMIISIIGAPIVFALSAIPGNETSMTNWFKQMIAYGLSIPAIWGVIGITIQFVVSMLLSVFTQGLPALGYTLFGVAFAPVMLIYGFYLAQKMPHYVDGWIMGEPKKGGKR